MVGVPGRSGGCATCRRKKKGVSLSSSLRCTRVPFVLVDADAPGVAVVRQTDPFLWSMSTIRSRLRRVRSQELGMGELDGW